MVFNFLVLSRKSSLLGEAFISASSMQNAILKS
jgi:hypothetical protein